MAKIIRAKGMGKRGPLPSKRRRVTKWVRKEIALGRIKSGERLPDRTWFYRKFDIAPVPVQQAFTELKDEGWIVPVPGHGTRVSDRLPFENRYLLLLLTDSANAGARFFAPALRMAAEGIKRAKGVCFDVKEFNEASLDSVEYAEMLESVRRHRYAGVIVQDMDLTGYRMDGLTNVDDVPMVFFGDRDVAAQGSLVVPLVISDDECLDRHYRMFFADLTAHGVGAVSVFMPDARGYDSYDRMSRLAREAHVELVADGFHCIEVNRWSPRQAGRLMRLFLRSDAGRKSDGIILGDENFLRIFADACRDVLGTRGASRYQILCHCNFPLLPEVDVPCTFHGLDIEATILSFLRYADDCHAGKRKPLKPMVVMR